MENACQKLISLPEISDVSADKKDLTMMQKKQIVTWIALAIINSYRITKQEDSNELIQEVTGYVKEGKKK